MYFCILYFFSVLLACSTIEVNERIDRYDDENGRDFIFNYDDKQEPTLQKNTHKIEFYDEGTI